MYSALPKRDVVLLGAGHTNAHIIRMWRMAPLADARLTVVSNFYAATYSGMLPGTLAGLYPADRMQIDLVRLCAVAGARLIRAPVTGLDLARQELLCADRPSIPFDVLSIGIGSVPRGAPGLMDDTVLPIKPMQTFLDRLEDRLVRLRADLGARPLQVAVVGAGAGGVEITFCLPERLRQICGQHPFELSLIDAADTILAGMPSGTISIACQELKRRGVRLLLGRAVEQVTQGEILLSDGSRHAADLVLWATGAKPPELLAGLGLPMDQQGFLLTEATLKSTAEVPVFAVGDCGSIRGQTAPKAGVYAVRQGPVLWGNLHRQLSGQPLLEYRPQPGFLSILATGDRRAILHYKGLTFHGRWCWRLKNRIDSRFMDKYQDYSTLPMAWPSADTNHRDMNQRDMVMRCAGCGGKIAGSVLSRVIGRLDIPASEQVLLGLEAPDDVAIIRPSNGQPIVTTVDFFTAFFDDPYLVGRVAALNSASDLFAKGAQPLAALAIATLPLGPQRQQEQLLYEMLAGSLHEFRQMGATLVGGHTLEGLQTTIGFSMLAQGNGSPHIKGNLRPGDCLVLTKPLGSGILLAAHMQARLQYQWLETLLEVLTWSNQHAAGFAGELSIQAITDVTGFGLAGHLSEMLRASNCAAEIELSRIPLLPGVGELIQQGVESTLSPANRVVEAEIQVNPLWRGRAEYAVLFDPQTSGGLLIGVPQENLQAALERCNQQRSGFAHYIGRVTSIVAGQPRIVLQ